MLGFEVYSLVVCLFFVFVRACVCVCFVTGLRVACFAFAGVADGVNCFLGGCAERLSQGIV